MPAPTLPSRPGSLPSGTGSDQPSSFRQPSGSGGTPCMRAAASSSHTARLAGIGLLPRSIARIDVSRAWSRLASSPLVQPICRSSASIRSFVTALGRARRARHHFRPLLNSWGHARTLMFGVSSAAAILASATAPVWGRSIVVLPASPRQSANAIGAYESPKGALSAHWSRLARRCKAITALVQQPRAIWGPTFAIDCRTAAFWMPTTSGCSVA